MNSAAIRKKFGDDYQADDNTFVMGIDQRFTSHFAERFKDLNVLETCTGAGFTTIPLASKAKHVSTIENNQNHQLQAIQNIKKANAYSNVSFILGNIMEQSVFENLSSIDAAFLDPDWAVSGPDHVYRFLNSNTQPPADLLLHKIFQLTENVCLVLPPFIDDKEFLSLPEHEFEKLYLGDSLELYCLYFGKLIKKTGHTEFRV